MRFFGVDFSGAADAGRRIWIAEIAAEPDALRVLSCCPAVELPGAPRGRDEAHAALVAHIAGAGEATFGLDFPFSLPTQLLDAESWTDFATQLAARFPDALAFQRDCARKADNRELRRDTDRAAKVPWCAYNLRLYRQTWHGIRDVLAPLVAADAARVCPMQPPTPGKPVLLEICPASALKRLGLYRSHGGYKTMAGTAERAALLEAVTAHWRLAVPPAIRDRIIANSGGDALDSVIAAAVAADVTRRGLSFHAADRTQALEGMVYV
jgi:hypothetical protein